MKPTRSNRVDPRKQSINATILRIYLDNDVCSGIARRDLPAGEMDATDRLFAWHHAKKIVLGTSRQSIREMEAAPAEHHEQLKAPMAMLDIGSDDHVLLGFSISSDQYGGYSASPLVTDIVDLALYSRVASLGLKPADAHHLMYAAHNGFDYFVTLDGDFLRRREALSLVCPSIEVCNPSTLVERLSPSNGIQAER